MSDHQFDENDTTPVKGISVSSPENPFGSPNVEDTVNQDEA